MSRKTPPIRDEERAYWTALAMADMAIYSHEGEECLLAHETSNEIRRKLIDQFGLNLDRFQERAREIFDEIYVARKQKRDEEKALHALISELFGEIDPP